MARGINVPITGDASRYMRELRKAQGVTSKFGVAARAALIGGAAAGFYALAKASKIGWDEFNAGQKVAAQTNAVIESTGGVANVTSGHVEDLGQELMRLSGIDDEVIKSGENVLLTFRGIHNEVGKGNDIFDQATKLTLDLSVALGRDMSDSAIQVGKALNDPIRGLSALRRVGVQFTDAQTAMVTKLVETGHKMEAQKIILGELRAEFGGSAKAAGQTFGGQLSILRERFNNFLGMLVEKAIPTLQRLGHQLGPIMERYIATTGAAIASLRANWAKFNALLERHQTTIARVSQLLHAMGIVIGVVVRWNVLLYSTMARVWLRAAGFVLTASDKIIGAIQRIVGWIRTLIGWIHSIPDINIGVHLPDIPGGGGLLSRIPGLASGGDITRTGIAKVHRGETVVPARAAMAGGGGGEVRVIVVGGDAQAIRYFNGLFGRDSKRNG